MKKIIAYTAVLAALMAVSCSRMEENNLAADLQSSVITLNLNPTEMVATRSDIPAVESVVSQFDWFFYPDATGTSAPVYHGHATVGESSISFSGTTDTPDDLGIDENGYHIGFDIETKFTNLKGNYYVYVLANYAGIDHSASDLTLETLLANTMETNWDEKTTSYTAIKDFVMDSYSGDDEADFPQLIPLSAAVADETDETKANLAVGLQRVAAKISFTLNIAKEIVDDAELGTKWRPLINSANFTTYLVNALTYATVEGEALDAESALATSHQLSYATSHVKTNKTETTSTTYIWEVDPFYTYPVEFDPASNNAPYFKLALPWENVDSNGNLTGKGSTLFYYKAYLRQAKGENETKGKALTKYERNKHYIVTLNVDVLGGTPEDYTTLETFYYVADWQSPAEGTYDGYFAPRYLDIARPAYYLYGDNSTTIAVTSSHVISATIRSVSQKTIAGGNKMTTVPSTAKVTPDGRVAFTLEYPLNTTIGSGNMDLTPITWTVRVYHSDDSSVYKDVIIYQYPSIYGEQNTTASTNSGYLNGVRFSTTQGGNPQNNPVRSNDNNKNLGGFYGGSPQSMDKLVLTVSSLASLVDVDGFTGVVIGDPRVRIAPLYNITRQGVTWDRNDLGVADGYIDNYLIADPNKNKVIAPRFMFPSGKIGANSMNGNFDNGGSWRSAAMRCAAYQEDGYPAGRWRLPTEAEVAFVRELQRHSYIDGLFFDTSRYWTASGTYYYEGAVHTASNTQTASVRCVYDLWYWGDTKYDNSGNPTTTAPATQWLGFMTE